MSDPCFLDSYDNRHFNIYNFAIWLQFLISFYTLSDFLFDIVYLMQK